jgi:hypothetical protein
MRCRTFGSTGLSVSGIGFGLLGMSGWTGSDDRNPPTHYSSQSADA